MQKAFNFVYLIMICLQISDCENPIEIILKRGNISAKETHYPKRNSLIVPYLAPVRPNNTYWAENNVWSKRRDKKESNQAEENTYFSNTPQMKSRVQIVVSNKTEQVDGQDVVFRVINGVPAKYGDVPWQVGYYKFQGLDSYIAFCGGALVTPTKMISAAHCFVTKRPSNCYKGELRSKDFQNTYAVMGSLRTKLIRTKSELKKKTYYEQFRKPAFGSYPKNFKFPLNDIAVVHTKTPFDINHSVQTIPFASLRTEYTGDCIVSGYGRINNYDQSTILLKAYIKPIPSYVCNKIHGKDMSKFICTSDTTADLHKGDSGGPLVCFRTGDPKESTRGLLVGVVSGKIMEQRFSTFFTRITSYSALVNGCRNYQFSFAVIIIAVIINYALLLF